MQALIVVYIRRFYREKRMGQLKVIHDFIIHRERIIAMFCHVRQGLVGTNLPRVWSMQQLLADGRAGRSS